MLRDAMAIPLDPCRGQGRTSTNLSARTPLPPDTRIPAYLSKANSKEEAKLRTCKGQREREDVLEETAYQQRPNYRAHVQ